MRSALLIAALSSLLSTGRAGSETLQVDEQAVKATFLLNFVKFVEWPSSAPRRDEFVIGVIGDDGIARQLESASRQRLVHGRALRVLRIVPEEDLRCCDVLFITEQRDQQTQMLLQRVSGPILTVGETPLFARAGGMIRFIVRENRLRFSINGDAAERAGLRIPAPLLSLAVPEP